MKSIVIKCGGSVFESLPESFYQEIVQLQESGRCFPILVHGGGPIISKLLSKLNIPTTFQKGLRVTTKEVLDVVEMVLNGLINKNIVSRLIQTGGTSVGLSGVDGSLIKAEQLDKNKELGWVGKVTEVNGKFLKAFKEQGLIPVVSPIGIGSAGEHYNINADAVAAAIAQAFRAPLCFVTDVPGISFNQNVLSTVTKTDVQNMLDSNDITGGMVPKVQAAIDSLQHHVPEVVILNGHESNALTRYLDGEQVGTKIILSEEALTHV